MAPPLDWDDVRYLLAIARHRRLLAAGRALHVRHTTVARRLAALEKSLGARLFHRTAGGFLLTDAGQEVLPVAEEIERATQSLRTRARPRTGAPRGVVRIAIVESWAAAWLAPRLGELSGRHRGLRVELVTGEAPTDLSGGEAEIALRTPRPKQKDLAAVKLASASIGLYATSALAAIHRPALDRDPPDGNAVPLLLYPPRYDFLQGAAWFRAVRHAAEPRLVTNSTMTLRAAALAGLGLAALPTFVARGTDLVRACGRELSRHDLWLVSHPDVRDEPRVRATIDWLRELAPTLADP